MNVAILPKFFVFCISLFGITLISKPVFSEVLDPQNLTFNKRELQSLQSNAIYLDPPQAGQRYLQLDLENPQPEDIYLGLRWGDSKPYILLLPHQKRQTWVIDLQQIEKFPQSPSPLELFWRTPSILRGQTPKSIRLKLYRYKYGHIPLRIDSYQVHQQSGFSGRYHVHAHSSLPADWTLEVKNKEGLTIQTQTFPKSMSPQWVVVQPQPRLNYRIKLTARREDKMVVRYQNLPIKSTDAGHSWLIPPNQRPAYYAPNLKAKLPPIMMASDRPGRLQLGLALPETGSIKWQFKHPKIKLQAYEEGLLFTQPPRYYYTTQHSGWTPDILKPLHLPVISPKQHTTLLYFEFTPSKGLKPGKYESNLRITYNSEAQDIPLRFEVKTALPRETPVLNTAFSLYPNAVKGQYPETASEMQAEAEALLWQHGISPDFIYRKQPLTIAEVKAILRLTQGRSKTNLMYFQPQSLENWDDYIAELSRTVDYLRKHQLTDKFYFYLFDEATTDELLPMRLTATRLEQMFPEIERLSTARIPFERPAYMWPDIDQWVPVTRDLAYGFQSQWAYQLLVNGYPFANWFLESDLIDARIIFWQAYIHQLEGLLYYTVNRWFANKQPIRAQDFPLLDWDPRAFQDTNGDGYLIYPGERAIWPSLRLKQIQQGWVDYRLLKTVEAKLGREEVLKMIRPLVRSVKDFDRDGAKLEALVSTLYQKLGP